MQKAMKKEMWAPNVIIVDADYLDRVAFDLTVNFERMIGRRVPQADLCHWLDCVALDGGLRPGENSIQVHFLHSKQRKAFGNFSPSKFEEDLNGLSFKDNLGTFELFAFPVEQVVTADDFFVQSLAMLAEAEEIKRLIVVGNMETYGRRVIGRCAETTGKEMVLLAMEPQCGTGFKQEILGYSLMSALGIRGEELR